MGIRVTCSDGTVFYYGDARLCPADAKATYLLGGHQPMTDMWQSIAVPFNDLSWAKGALPGETLPNAPINAVEILSDLALDIRDLAFLRPRGTRISTETGQGSCVAGRVREFQPGQQVNIAVPGGRDSGITQAVDQRGIFCFSNVANGIYELQSEACGRIFRDRRGALIEVTANLVTLDLVAET